MNDDEIIKRFQELKKSTQALAYDNRKEKDRIEERLKMLIRNKFGGESHYLRDLLNVEFYCNPLIYLAYKDNSRGDYQSWREGKSKWCNLIDTMIEEIQSFPPAIEVAQTSATVNVLSTQNRKIFIVHGHDDEMVQATARFVKQIGFDPVILKEQPNQDRTIIEKFEDYADVPIAIVLFSPDDLGKAKDEDSLKPRPRQNVVFELGFFIGKLGRNKVVVLHKVVENFEMFSDFQGVLFEPFKDGWELKVAKEIKTAGFNIDLNQLL